MTEKPMVIDEQQCQAVLDAEKRNNRNIVVTFNYRYAPKHRTVKELLMSGEIGKVLSVDFSWYLDVISRRRLLPPLASARNGGGSLLGSQSDASLRSDELVARCRPGRSRGRRQTGVYGKNGPFRASNCRPCPHK